MSCSKCAGTGVIETGNNDLPCDCPAGAAAKFNVSAPGGMRQKTGAEIRQEETYRRNQSANWPLQSKPEPPLPPPEALVEVANEARDMLLAKRVFAAFDEFVHVPPELEAKLLARIEQELKKP